MMKQYILIMLFTLAGLAGMAQTNEPLPGDAEPLTNQLYLSPSDSTVWAADPFSGLAIKVGTWFKVDSLFKEGYTKAQVDSAITVNISFQNVKSFGAVGDGVTDDTEAIRDAMEYLRSSGDGRLFFPEGVYMISGTVYIPSDVEIFGDGKEKSVIKNMPGAELDLIIPYGDLGDTQAENNYKYLTMLATETADKSVDDSVSSVIIHSMAFDWNGADCGPYSAVELLIGSAVDCHVFNVRLYPALPADLNNTDNTRRGRNILFAFAQDCSIYNSVINAADYESVSAWYLSKQIHVYNNLFDIEKPLTFRRQNHAVQIASPPLIEPDLIAQYGEYKAGPVFVYNNSFLMKSGLVHAITSHTGKGMYIFNNYIKSYPDNLSSWAIKPFAGTEDFIVSGNVIDYTESGYVEWGVTVIAANEQNITHEECYNGVISNNIVKVNQSASSPKPVIGGDSTVTNNLIVEGNMIDIYNYVDSAVKAISFNGDNISIRGNTINYHNPLETITSSGPVGIYSKPSNNVQVEGNTIIGEVGTGIAIDTTGNAIIVANNIIADNKGVSVVSGGGVSVAPLTVDGIKSDSDGNIDLSSKYLSKSGGELTGALIGTSANFTGVADFNLKNNNWYKDADGSDRIYLGGSSVLTHAILFKAANSTQVFRFRDHLNNDVLTINGSNGAVTSSQYRLSVLNTPPASATDTGTTGEIRFGTDGRIYICTGTNTWIRSDPLTTW